jgi:hypothetical protein
MPEITVREVARLVGGVPQGDAERVLRGVKPLDEAGADDLSFVAEPRYHPYIRSSRAGAVLLAATPGWSRRRGWRRCGWTTPARRSRGCWRRCILPPPWRPGRTPRP